MKEQTCIFLHCGWNRQFHVEWSRRTSLKKLRPNQAEICLSEQNISVRRARKWERGSQWPFENLEFYFFYYNFIYLFLGMLSPLYCTGFCLAMVSGGYYPVAVHRLLTAVPVLAAEHGLCSCCSGTLSMQFLGSRAQAQ